MAIPIIDDINNGQTLDKLTNFTNCTQQTFDLQKTSIETHLSLFTVFTANNNMA